MMKDVSLKVFEEYAKDIAEMYNLIQKSSKYSTSSIELLSTLVDYKDGKGYQIVSRGLIRNPEENVYDFLVDIIGTQMDALTELKNKILLELQKQNPEEHKKRLFKLN